MLRMGEMVLIKKLDFLKKYSPSFTTERPVTGVVVEIIPEVDGSVTFRTRSTSMVTKTGF